ncbi:hypothetical protein SUDANB1_07189 [Streptomyces sp. enrichment culture]
MRCQSLLVTILVSEALRICARLRSRAFFHGSGFLAYSRFVFADSAARFRAR